MICHNLYIISKKVVDFERVVFYNIRRRLDLHCTNILFKLMEDEMKKETDLFKKLVDYLNGTKIDYLEKRDTITDERTYLLEGITYAIPINSTPTLRRYVAAAISCYKNHTAFEKELNSQNPEDFEDESCIDKRDMIWILMNNISDISVYFINNIHDTLIANAWNMTFGETMYFFVMVRLRESFKSVLSLMEKGFYIECTTILRLIYEQLCLACYVIDETDNDNIKNNWSNKDVRYLKEKINGDYGRLYSLLSDEAHLSINSASKYLNFDKLEDRITVRGRSGERVNNELEYMILLLHIYIEVFSYGIRHFELEKEEKYIDMVNVLLIGHKYIFDIFKDEVNFKLELLYRV